jgi:S-adenosylmethionine/arginine decarboxylase-like enzyme
MKKEYRIEPAGSQFTVIDPWGEQVHTYPTEEAAKQDIERCKKEVAVYETAKQLVDMAVKTHMKMFEVDRETASYGFAARQTWCESLVNAKSVLFV